MPKAKKLKSISALSGTYKLKEQLGQGGAGVVFAAVGPAGEPVAIKLLKAANSEKRKRFRNEVAFLERKTHPCIVQVLDKGLAQHEGVEIPYYVMPRYVGSLRQYTSASSTLSPQERLQVFLRLLDGVEAAHLLGVTHRDLKPENVLCGESPGILVVADFGIASFAEEFLATAIETQDGTRLANFVYAAPEQRGGVQPIDERADIYALGLILNELFTGVPPLGTEYKQIAGIASEFGYLDLIVRDMIRQTIDDRPKSISEVKGRIRMYAEEAVTVQKLSEISKQVVPVGTIDDPLAINPAKLIDFDWRPNGRLKLFFDRQVHSDWIVAFNDLQNVTHLPPFVPRRFLIQPEYAEIEGVGEPHVSSVIQLFKEWLPKTSERLHEMIHERNVRAEQEEKTRLRLLREGEEARLRVMRSVKL